MEVALEGRQVLRERLQPVVQVGELLGGGDLGGGEGGQVRGGGDAVGREVGVVGVREGLLRGGGVGGGGRGGAVVHGVRVALLGGVGGDEEAEDLEGVGGLGGRGADTEGVARGDADGARLEAQAAVDLDAEVVPVVLHVDLAGAAQVAVGELAVAEGEAVDAGVRGVVGGAVVEVAAQHAGRAAEGVDDEDEAVEPRDRVDARGADGLQPVTHKPELQAAAAALRARGAEGERRVPFGRCEGLLGPEGGALVAGRGRREDDFVGEDLGRVGFAEDGVVGDGEEVGRYPRCICQCDGRLWCREDWDSPLAVSEA